MYKAVLIGLCGVAAPSAIPDADVNIRWLRASPPRFAEKADRRSCCSGDWPAGRKIAILHVRRTCTVRRASHRCIMNVVTRRHYVPGFLPRSCPRRPHSPSSVSSIPRLALMTPRDITLTRTTERKWTVESEYRLTPPPLSRPLQPHRWTSGSRVFYSIDLTILRILTRGYFSGVSLLRQGRSVLSFLSFLSHLLRSRPFNPARVQRSAVSSPSGVRGWTPAQSAFLCTFLFKKAYGMAVVLRICYAVQIINFEQNASITAANPRTRRLSQ